MKEKIIGLALSLLLRAWARTLRIECQGIENIPQNLGGIEEKAPLLCFWHGHQIFIYAWHFRFLYPRWKRPICALISEHGDGRIAAHTVKCLGVHSIAGSSTRGGTRAFLQLLKKIRKGNIGGITPDGPRGPIFKVKPGVIQLAAKTGAPITPLAIGSNRLYEFSSWDKMRVPYPFSRLVFVVAEAIRVPAKITKEQELEYALHLERTLNNITDQADNYYK